MIFDALVCPVGNVCRTFKCSLRRLRRVVAREQGARAKAPWWAIRGGAPTRRCPPGAPPSTPVRPPALSSAPRAEARRRGPDGVQGTPPVDAGFRTMWAVDGEGRLAHFTGSEPEKLTTVTLIGGGDGSRREGLRAGARRDRVRVRRQSRRRHDAQALRLRPELAHRSDDGHRTYSSVAAATHMGAAARTSASGASSGVST